MFCSPLSVSNASHRTSEKSLMKNVLVVDDSQTMRRMIVASLRSITGARFSEASSGLEALERLTLEHVDIMILVLNMPDMHGLEVLKFVRRHQIYSHMPIIVLTTRGDEGSRTDAIAAGASRYLTKPFEPHSLAAFTRELLSTAGG